MAYFQKHKPYISKQVPCILKYMARIFLHSGTLDFQNVMFSKNFPSRKFGMPLLFLRFRLFTEKYESRQLKIYCFIPGNRRAIYFPIISNSMFTTLPTLSLPRLVISEV